MSSGTPPPVTHEGAGPLLVVISGPSGVGKDTVLARMKERGLPLHFTVTATTRPPREENSADPLLALLNDEAFDRLPAEDGPLAPAPGYGDRCAAPPAPLRGGPVRRGISGCASAIP